MSLSCTSVSFFFTRVTCLTYAAIYADRGSCDQMGCKMDLLGVDNRRWGECYADTLVLEGNCGVERKFRCKHVDIDAKSINDAYEKPANSRG